MRTPMSRQSLPLVLGGIPAPPLGERLTGAWPLAAALVTRRLQGLRFRYFSPAHRP